MDNITFSKKMSKWSRNDVSVGETLPVQIVEQENTNEEFVLSLQQAIEKCEELKELLTFLYLEEAHKEIYDAKIYLTMCTHSLNLIK